MSILIDKLIKYPLKIIQKKKKQLYFLGPILPTIYLQIIKPSPIPSLFNPFSSNVEYGYCNKGRILGLIPIPVSLTLNYSNSIEFS